jgi:DNA-directed RNA polymerase specialized sigma24 family protein
MGPDATDFHDFIAPRLDSLRRVAYVLSRDWYRADDLVSDCVVKVMRSWSRIE